MALACMEKDDSEGIEFFTFNRTVMFLKHYTQGDTQK